MSSRLELTLTSHELFVLSPDTPATGAAVRVEMTPSDDPHFFPKNYPSFSALARLVKTPPYQSNDERNHYRVFFRNEQSGEDEIFCGCKILNDSLSFEELCKRRIGKPDLIPSTRFWKAPELPYCVALRSNGQGEIIEAPGQYVSNDTFHWCDWTKGEKALFFEWNTEQFHSFCRQLVLNPDSDLNFFLKWKTLSPDHKSALAIQCENGNWQQMVRLFSQCLRIILHYFALQLGKSGFAVNLRERIFRYNHKRQIVGWEWVRRGFPTHESPVYPYAFRLQEAVFKIVRPAFWLPPRPLCCYQWIQGLEKVEYTVECEMPTMHEFMEAQLELRDFFEPYLSTEEIEALLTPEIL